VETEGLTMLAAAVQPGANDRAVAVLAADAGGAALRWQLRHAAVVDGRLRCRRLNG